MRQVRCDVAVVRRCVAEGRYRRETADYVCHTPASALFLSILQALATILAGELPLPRTFVGVSTSDDAFDGNVGVICGALGEFLGDFARSTIISCALARIWLELLV